MTIDPWRIIASSYLVRDRWLNLRADRCQTRNGIIVDPFYILECRDWAHVVAFDPDFRVLIVRQYRHGAQRVCAEIPCGVIDESDNSPLEAIKREMMEETGCRAARFESLGSAYANPARQTNLVHAFAAFDVQQVADQSLDEVEEIEYEFVDIQTLMGMIDSGEFCQSLHITSFFQALRHCRLLEKAYQ